jgi:hypothetical protein
MKEWMRWICHVCLSAGWVANILALVLGNFLFALQSVMAVEPDFGQVRYLFFNFTFTFTFPFPFPNKDI